MPLRIPRYLGQLAIVLAAIFFILIVALSSHGALYTFVTNIDYSVQNFFAPYRTLHPLSEFMLVLTYLGNPEMIIAFEISLLSTIIVIHRKRIAALFLTGIVAGEVLSLFFKNLLVRSRPLETVIHISRVGYSFPSGHAMLSMVFYGCLGVFAAHISSSQMQKKIIAIVCGLLIFLIGLSRIFLGVHWFSDVVGGWCLGGVCLLIIVGIFNYIHHHVPGESLRSLSRQEKLWLIVVALMIGFFVAFFFVTHLSELRSIV